MAGESARDVAARSRAKAERLMRHADLYDRGADGEASTAAVLANLPSQWHTMHDLRWPGRQRANIDHIVVGPGGVFVVDSKNWSGSIDVDRDVLRQNGRSRETAVAAAADAALAVASLPGRHAARVYPVLCFVRAEPIAGWARDVMLCSTATLAEMLLSRPVVLNSDQVAEARATLEGELRPARRHESLGGPAARSLSRGRPLTGHTPVRRRPTPRRRTGRTGRREPTLARLLVALALLIGLMSMGPQLATAIGGLVAAQLTKPVGGPSCVSPASQQPSRARPVHARGPQAARRHQAPGSASARC